SVFGAHDQSVNHNRDCMVHPPIELRRVSDLDELAVHDRANETLFASGIEQLTELAFAPAHEGRQDLDLAAFRPDEDGVGDLPRALPLDGPAAIRAVRGSGAGVEKSQVVVDLRNRPDG